MNINDAFPSSYLKAEDLDGDTELTIKGIEVETLGEDKKPVVYFEEDDRGLVLNKTNAMTLKGLHGLDTDAWVGNKATLFPTQTDFQGRQVAAIRVRMN